MKKKAADRRGEEGKIQGEPERCSEVGDQVASYLEGLLPSGPKTRFEGHVERCIQCRGLLVRARKRREAFNRVLAEAITPSNKAPFQLVENVRTCLRCFSSPGSEVCPRLRGRLRLVTKPVSPLE
jgi:hypothetical protein